MFDLDSFIIAVYLLVCDLYRQLFPNGVRERGFTPELTDEEALTIGIVGEYLGLPTDKAIYRYFRRHYQAWFPRLKEPSWCASGQTSGSSNSTSGKPFSIRPGR